MNKWIKLLNLFGMLDKAVSSISGELRDSIVAFLIELRVKAALTDNKYDDILAYLLCVLFSVPEEK